MDLQLVADVGTGLASLFGGYFLATYTKSTTELTSLNGISWPIFPEIGERPTPIFMYRYASTETHGYPWRIGTESGSSSSNLFMGGDVSCPEDLSYLSYYDSSIGDIVPQPAGTWSFQCDHCE